MIRKRMNGERTLDSYMGLKRLRSERQTFERQTFEGQTRQQKLVQKTLTDTYQTGTRNVMLFVEASAGTGKTTCIANGYLEIDSSKRPLCLSFNRSTVKEISAKCGLKVAEAKAEGMLTFAGFAWRVCTQLGMIKMRTYKCNMTSLPGNLHKVLTACTLFKCSLYVDYLKRGKCNLEQWRSNINDSSPQCLLDFPDDTYSPKIACDAVEKVQSKMLASKKGLCEATRDDLAILLLKGIETEARLPDVAKLFLNRGAIIDEAQDLNPSTLNILDLVLKRRSFDKRPPLALFGDSSQQINAWNGAVNAFKKLKDRCSESEVTRVELTLTESFRFGPDVAELRNYIVSRTRFHGSWPSMTASSMKKTPILKWEPCMVPVAMENKTVTVLCRSHSTLRDLALQCADQKQPVFVKNLSHSVWDGERASRGNKGLKKTLQQTKGDVVVFQTIHTMKGGESDVVYVAHDVMKWLENPEAVKQEDVCLAIVALTRVKTTALYIPPILYNKWVYVNRYK